MFYFTTYSLPPPFSPTTQSLDPLLFWRFLNKTVLFPKSWTWNRNSINPSLSQNSSLSCSNIQIKSLYKDNRHIFHRISSFQLSIWPVILTYWYSTVRNMVQNFTLHTPSLSCHYFWLSGMDWSSEDVTPLPDGYRMFFHFPPYFFIRDTIFRPLSYSTYHLTIPLVHRGAELGLGVVCSM